MKYIIQHIRNYEETINILKELINNKHITQTTIETIYHGYRHIDENTTIDKQIYIITTYTQDKITEQTIEDCFKGKRNNDIIFDIIKDYKYIQNNTRFYFDGCMSIKFESEKNITNIINNFKTQTAIKLIEEYVHYGKIEILEPI